MEGDAGSGVALEGGMLKESGQVSSVEVGGLGWELGIGGLSDEGVPLAEGSIVLEEGVSGGGVGDYMGAEQFGHDLG